MKSIQIFVFLFITSCIMSCKKNSSLQYILPDSKTINPVAILLESIKVEGDLGNFSVEKTETTESDGVQLINFKFTADNPSELQPATIHFNFPSVDVNGYWNPKISIDKVNYFNSGVTSKASSNAPVLAFYNGELKNRMTIALSDALNQSEFNSWLKEEDVNFHPRVYLFREKMPKTTSYEVTLRIDTRNIPYYESIDNVASWWAKMPEYKPMHVPEAAKEPMYSTWYSYHQSITAEEIVAECKIAKSLGCGAVIIDDGWQTKDVNRGYAFTGDWNPDRIPDMKGFVDAVHNEGMKFLLWYSLPFMGENAKNYSKFKGKYLRYWDGQGTYVMDPRYPEVREYIVNTYIKAMQDWNLDGFKLDFIGRFTATDDTVLTKADGRDYASVNVATDVLMTEVTNRLTAIKPDILIEFRQPYIGPVMRKYGNMFRGVDAPNNAVANKIETTNLRILSQNTAVHSDMFIWRPEENVEEAALQILNILYSVPQLSVRLEEIPEDHLNMIRYWFAYWNTNKHILMDGKFIPSNPTTNYPWLTAINDEKQITTVYEDVIVTIDNNAKQIDLINAKASTAVVFTLEKDSNTSITIIDCEGNIIFENDTFLSKGINSIQVPKSGMLSLKL
ncbi:MAG: alpha-galactosidase [Bacteroidetes bacterium]|nr:MAG: alpha-galactosidase [Bacteroidota bacterium]